MATLLMTATVTPPVGAITLKRMNPTDRLRDYAEALHFYIKCLEDGVIDSIVFADNSNSDIQELKDIAGCSIRCDDIEFISFYGLDHPPENGRAYGELKLIDYAMRTSRTIADAAQTSVIWKVTGRYIVRNIASLQKVRKDAVLMCHCRDYPYRLVDMYFMGWTKAGYLNLLAGVIERMKENELTGFPEIEFRHWVDERARIYSVQRRFSTAPYIEGIRGVDGKRYESEAGKMLIRNMLNRVAPWVWI